MLTFDRASLSVEVKQNRATLDITLVDTENEATLELEAKRIGSLDAKALIELLMLSEHHVDSAGDDEVAATE